MLWLDVGSPATIPCSSAAWAVEARPSEATARAVATSLVVAVRVMLLSWVGG